MECQIHMVMSNSPVSAQKIEEFKRETRNDNIFRIVKQYIDNGWPK